MITTCDASTEWTCTASRDCTSYDSWRNKEYYSRRILWYCKSFSGLQSPTRNWTIEGKNDEENWEGPFKISIHFQKIIWGRELLFLSIPFWFFNGNPIRFLPKISFLWRAYFISAKVVPDSPQWSLKKICRIWRLRLAESSMVRTIGSGFFLLDF